MSDFQREKFKAVVHYAIERSNSDFGKVKLHKVLYFADMLHFIEHGAPLTGVDYVKQKFGPVARHLKWALDQLTSEGKISITVQSYFGFPKFDFAVHQPCESNSLSHDEKNLLDEVVRFVADHNATSISELSHNEAWEAVDLGDVIPYETAYWLVPMEVTDSDIAWGRAQAANIFRADVL